VLIGHPGRRLGAIVEGTFNKNQRLLVKLKRCSLDACHRRYISWGCMVFSRDLSIISSPRQQPFRCARNQSCVLNDRGVRTRLRADLDPEVVPAGAINDRLRHYRIGVYFLTKIFALQLTGRKRSVPRRYPSPACSRRNFSIPS
jgi:hypothetical protein